MNEMTIGQRIASRRKLMNLSQESLAEQLCVSRQAVSKWESDAAIPEIDKLIALSKLYDVSVGWLLGVEAQERSGNDELTEAQLKMVEEIVKRYKPEPAGRRLLYNLAVVLAGLLTIVFLFTRAYPHEVAPNPDYSLQIAGLEANYSSLQTQIDKMDALLSAQSETSKLLRSYTPLCYLNEDLTTVDMTFYFFPKVYHENMTAYLSICNPAAGFSQMLECSWTGDRYLVHATLPLADRYRYSFLLVSQTGYEEEMLDESTYYSDLLTHSVFYIAEDHPKYAQLIAVRSSDIGTSETTYRFDAPLYMPRILEKNGYVPFRDVKITLLLNGEAIWEADYTAAFLELYKKENITLPLTTDIQAELPQLHEGDHLILQVTATTHTDRTLITILDDLTVTIP